MSVSSSDLHQPPHVETAELAPAVSPHGRFSGRRFAVFASVVLLFLLAINAFVCATAGVFFGLPGWLTWQAIPAVLLAGFIATTILGFVYSNMALRAAYAISAATVGALNFAFFAAIACWVLYGVDFVAGSPASKLSIAVVCFAAAGAATLYGMINATWIRTTSVRAELPNLPTAWEGRTIALVTDLHLGHISGPGFVRRVISRLRAAQPDAVFISGDMFDGTTVDLNGLVAPWKDYAAPRGIFYVTGNHDEFAERNIYLQAVADTGIRVLNNEKLVVDGLQIIGVHDSEAGDAPTLRTILRQAEIDRAQPSILLAHQPVNLPVAEEEGVSLQLSGHTHRGQIWPWSWLVARIYGPFAYGLQRLGNLLVYTSSGVGTWGPPLRVGTRSEIVLIRLESSGDSGPQAVAADAP